MNKITKLYNAPIAETPREAWLETLLEETLPYLVEVELSTKTSASLRLLIKSIDDAVHGK